MKLCDMLSENTVNLEAGKRYLAYATLSAESLQSFRAGDMFFVPQSITGTPQVDAEGNRLNDGVYAADDYGGHAGAFMIPRRGRSSETGRRRCTRGGTSYPVLAAVKPRSAAVVSRKHGVFIGRARDYRRGVRRRRGCVHGQRGVCAQRRACGRRPRAAARCTLRTRQTSPQWEFGFQVQWRGGRSPGLLNAAGEPYSVVLRAGV